VADAARFDFDPHLPRAGRRDFTFNYFERTIRTSDLRRTHLRHNSSDRIPS
jgi:hypothetical protein